MCGIAGILLKKGPGNVGEAMAKMLWALKHRGPDSAGYALYGQNRKGDYIVWVKLPEVDEELDEVKRLSDLYKDEVADVIADAGGSVRSHQFYTKYAVRLDVDYRGDIKRLIDLIEENAPAEVVSFGKSMELIKDVGLPNLVAQRYAIPEFQGTHALGHVRMATESAVDVSHAHPFWAYPFSDICVVHNGQITNYWKFRRSLELDGWRFRSHNDSELIAVYLAVKMKEGLSLREAMELSVKELDGVFTYFVATESEIGVAKDTLAAKPLVVMEDEHAVAIASEEVALRTVFPAEIDSWDPYEGQVLVWSKKR